MGLDGSASAEGTRGWTILVVDDDAAQRTAAAELLSARGYAVVVACDGQEACERLEGGLLPDLIVLDLTMPRMDGWTFLRHLRGAAGSTVPVLVTSAMARERPPEGADACLEKPIEPSQFRALVARLSSGARGRSGTSVEGEALLT
jgi:CheY-like chemotaxis protein